MTNVVLEQKAKIRHQFLQSFRCLTIKTYRFSEKYIPWIVWSFVLHIIRNMGEVILWHMRTEKSEISLYAFTQSNQDRLYSVLYYILQNPKICKRITKTYLYNFDPLKPHFYIVKMGFTGVYIIFLNSAKKHRLWVLVRTASARRF